MSSEDIESFEAQFSRSVRQQANTAVNEAYLSNIEKELFYYLNLARLEPQLFSKTFVTNYHQTPGYKAGYAFEERKQSLMSYLSTMEALDALEPSRMLSEIADCFATSSGKTGYVGHERLDSGCISISEGLFGECCAYSRIDNGLWHILQLLVDAGEDNGDLGHRKILLDIDKPHDSIKKYMGVAVRSHTKFGMVSVLDLWTESNKNRFDPSN